MIIYLWTKILQYTWKIWQIILSPEDVCFQFQYPQIIFQPICQFEFMIKKIGVQFFSQLNHPRENLSSWQTFVCKRNFVWVLPMSSHKALNIFDCNGRVFWLLLVLPRSKLFSMKPKSFLLTCIFVKNTVTAATIAVCYNFYNFVRFPYS